MENETDLECAIGERVRQLRTGKGMTLDELASASGVSRAMISRIERAEASPTAPLLSRICAALGQSLSSFFAMEEDGSRSPFLRRDGQPVWRDPIIGYQRRSVSPPGTGSAVDIVEVEFPPGGRASFPPQEASRGMTQHVWLLDGVLEMTTADGVYRMAPGDCLFMHVGAGHSFYNPGGIAARYVVVFDRGYR
ncbi:helix-turn-helix domain-containing protein [Rhizobiaceae bacterium n13]|uniref:Helix-turn-helix domain-containing protein n=1 Tax=Ferirhizobium litorale TaxID=2927786 RepID=A0AAE3U4I3_9HYPH|nr:helix-turn-helix domain-containing protein [Fererhizobium litorale]MDI7864532.1 helix-turn-helix domain-containing protein [Fererhizobium litorale]MDI7924927.1 helix-turn-helix domain-containing protein [Fererhizobium litorale]